MRSRTDLHVASRSSVARARRSTSMTMPSSTTVFKRRALRERANWFDRRFWVSSHVAGDQEVGDGGPDFPQMEPGVGLAKEAERFSTAA